MAIVSSKVRLYGHSSGLSDVLLHPETELAAIVCTSGGLLNISGNYIAVPESAVGSVISSSGFIQEPLLEYTSGGTVTNIGVSTGYGTLLNSITVTPTVRLPASSASNDVIPTEKAVAIGLDRKQDALIAGNFIGLSPDGAGHTIISALATTTIRSGAAAVDTVLPTEKAVQYAIAVASGQAVSSAVAEAISSAGSATYKGPFHVSANASAFYIGSGIVYDEGGAVLANVTSKAFEFIDGAVDGTLYLKFDKTNDEDDYVFSSGTPSATLRWYPIAYLSGTSQSQYFEQQQYGDIIYTSAWGSGGSGGSGGMPVSQGSGVIVTNAGTSYTVALAKATTTSLGGVVVGAGLGVSGGTVYVTDATYAGPFAVTSVGGTTAAMTVAVNGGYVKWLDGNKWVTNSAGGASRWTVSSVAVDDDRALYLVGSSGAVAGVAITSRNYTADVLLGAATTPTTYTRTDTSAGSGTGSRFMWTAANQAAIWAAPDLTVGTPVYNSAVATTAVGQVATYSGSIQLSGGTVYTRSSTDTGDIHWTDANGNVVYTASAWPAAGDSTLFSQDTKFAYATSQSALPPAGAFYTMLAQNQGGTLKQQQYGTVWHEHWGDDYRGQFAISRVAVSAMNATDVPAAGAYTYKYIIGNGGQLYGGIDFSSGRIWAGGLTAGGVMLAPGDIMYPTKSVDGTNKNDGLYFPYGTAGQVWLNVWSGTWPGVSDQESWYTVVDSQCLEGTIPGCYSVQLGWVTPNGAPQQEHKGAIAIRGRWA